MDDIKKEFEMLKGRFAREVARASHFDLPSLFKDSIRLFDRLKDKLKGCSEEERKQVLDMLSEMQQFLSSETKKIAARSGMTEEQLSRYAENPNNFSSEQWKSMQIVKEKLAERGQELKEVIRKDSGARQPMRKVVKGKKSRAKITKSGWIRS